MNLNADQALKLAVALFADSEHQGEASVGEEGREHGWLMPGPFGRYVIESMVGAGGMGEVYAAQQESPARRVAIKVLRPELVSGEALRRFEHETRILGRLEHPGIASIFEAGQVETPTGRTPFFAMEFVDGKPLTAFATGGKLPLRARLELFLKVCEAVEHAHRKGVIHRDLKPGNILVDAAGRPRVMDFGVARATDSDIRATSLHTEVGRLVGTLPYMSPEQVGGDPDALDTRSDVYSLGVILYELLGGRLPYELKGEGRGRIPEAIRAIQESEPAPLSSIDRVFRGDLETIVGKALAKERDRRYQSVGDLAADIRRYLEDEPIVARRPSGWYQMRKFARRNPGIVAAALFSAAVLLAGMGVCAWEMRIAVHARGAADEALAAETRARAIAEAKRSLADASTEFLQNVVGAADPDVAQGRPWTVIDALNHARSLIGERFGDKPDLEAAVREVLGRTYRSLGRTAEAETELRRALELNRGDDEASAEVRRSTQANLANVLVERGQRAEAKSLAAEAMSGPEPTDIEGKLNRLSAKSILASVDAAEGNVEASIRLEGEVLSARRELVGELHPQTISSLILLAGRILDMRRPTEALEYARAAHEAASKVLGDEHPTTARAKDVLAATLHQLGRLAEAESLFRDVIRRNEQVLGQGHDATLSAKNNLAMVLLDEGRVDEADALLGDIMAAARQAGTPERNLLTYRANQAAVRKKKGDLEGAASLYKEIWELVRAESGPDHPNTLLQEFNLGRALYDQKKYSEAEPVFADVSARARTGLPATHVYPGVFAREHGKCLYWLGRYDEAETELLESERLLESASGIRDQRTQLTIASLVTLYEKTGKPDAADRWRNELVPSPSKRESAPPKN